MDTDRAITIIESVLAPKVLNYVQIEIVRGVLAGSSYQEIVKPLPEQGEPDESEKYKISYVKDVAAELWKTLTPRLGKKVTKKSLAAVLLWYTKQPGFRLADSNDPSLEDFQLMSSDRSGGIESSRAILAIDGGFYGRMEEFATLTDWCLVERCRLIFLVGMGGMGKTRLAWEVAHLLVREFDRTIWRSLVDAPSITELCTDLIECLQPEPLRDLPDTVEGQIELLIACLKQDRCLLVLDNVESILEAQVQCGQYLPGYDGYDRLFRAIGELPHQSCAILTSREKPHTIARSQIVNPQLVRSMNIDCMTASAAYQLVKSYGCPQLPAQMWQEIHTHYNGNPLALKIATIAAVEITGGGEKMLELYPLMKQGKLKFQHIDDVLARQFDRLSEIEQQLVYWLAIEREPITGSKLRADLVLNPHAPGEIINALQSLSRRCITVCHERKWSIQPVMTAYVTRRLIDRFVTELSPGILTNLPRSDIEHNFFYLNTYAIIQPKNVERVRQTQIQSILHPILDRLSTIWTNHIELSRQLHQILTQWQSLNPIPSGYLVDNILALKQGESGS
jgi:NB-ARC domain